MRTDWKVIVRIAALRRKYRPRAPRRVAPPPGRSNNGGAIISTSHRPTHVSTVCHHLGALCNVRESGLGIGWVM